MRRLAVELYGTLVGTLEGTDRASADFHSDPNAIDRFGINSHVLSASIPLSPKPSRAKAKRRRSFFQELLPEGDQLTAMNIAAGLAPGDDIDDFAGIPALVIERYDRDPATPGGRIH
ncbi:HipA N-terminal domain-containing protein [Nocardia cyriacigeorgica]|uniref:HipA N-terminal domain-containing protein n=1 Tax=Nocardia cyriacigeorgica TaxID=135487 RepID=UPI00281130C5|nr:HipA N-terminal domain-containing protein [Nocardia cyriacigeorgica]